MKNVVELLNTFSEEACPKLKIDKSECKLLGHLKSSCKSIENIKVTNEAVKTLGIYIAHDKVKCLEKIWQDKIAKITKI